MLEELRKEFMIHGQFIVHADRVLVRNSVSDAKRQRPQGALHMAIVLGVPIVIHAALAFSIVVNMRLKTSAIM